MKGNSFNFIPSLQDFSILHKQSGFLPNQMQLIVSKKQFDSCKSIERFIIDNPLQQDQISFHSAIKNAQNPQKQVPLSTKQLFRTPKKKKNGCLCKKIDCLKLYCECFKNGKACTEECDCNNCQNIEGKIQQNCVVRSSKKNRNKNIQQGRKVCTCKKTQCQKKYCQCYNAGLPCTDACKCTDCHN